MNTFVVDVSQEAGVRGDRSTIGGWPVLEAGQAVPVCECGLTMALFFQVAVPHAVPVFGGDQLLVFQCPDESDCSDAERQLPTGYWDQRPKGQGFWRILLQRNGSAVDEVDPYLQVRRLVLSEVIDASEYNEGLPLQDFKVGGAPFWFQGPEWYRCACGTDMVFLCHVPENFDFYQFLNADVDMVAFDDGLLVGNAVYILACPQRCHPAAAFPVCQN
ncbi:hypothetical protein [Nocardia sp. NPDC059195]|uniref:hypothetical protein n=1 Tax=Nocardia sp. NPDC059195 TaxID=3346765 RepID=UPI00369A6180